MLVKVHLLMISGKRVPANEVRQQPTLLGGIRLYPGPRSTVGDRGRVAVLRMSGGKSLELHDVQLTQWDARGLILAGEERLYGAHGAIAVHRQAWLCRPLGASELMQPTPVLESLESDSLVEQGADA